MTALIGAFVFVGLDPNTVIPVRHAGARPVRVRGHGRGVRDVGARGLRGGDVRAGSMKQLAAATGEGVPALLAIRRYLDEIRPGGKVRAPG
jgi:thioredoxin reductase